MERNLAQSVERSLEVPRSQDRTSSVDVFHWAIFRSNLWSTTGSSKAVVLGGVCLGVGIWVKVDSTYLIYLTRVSNDVTNLGALNVPSLIESASIILIAGGAAVFIVAFLGCCGAIKENTCCLYLYIALVVMILGVQVASVVLAVMYSSQFQNYAQTYMNATLIAKYVGPYDTSSALSLAWDIAHVKLTCCGATGPDDFASISAWNTTWVNPSTNAQQTATIPATCCQSTSATSYPLQATVFFSNVVDAACPVTKASSNTAGCFDALKTLFSKYFYLIIGIGAGVVLLEVFGIISACCINKKKNDVESV